MIVLFGATGYTGRRTAEAMVRRGLRPVLAGRSVARLTALARRLENLGPDNVGTENLGLEHLGSGKLEVVSADVGAFGHDYVPGNLAGALALRLAGSDVHRVEVGYLIDGGGRAQLISRGTFASLVGLVTEQGFTWRDGIRTEHPGSRIRTFVSGGRDCPALSIGSTEHYCLPRLAGTGGLPEVDVYFGWFGPAARAVQLSSRITPIPPRSARSGGGIRPGGAGDRSSPSRPSTSLIQRRSRGSASWL